MRPARAVVAAVTLVALLATACSGATTRHPASTAGTTSNASTTNGSPVAPTGSASLPTAPVGTTVGASGVGDPYFPLEGNGGYDVGHYDLDLSYTPTGHHLAGTTTVTARATQDLTRFDLDLSGMAVSALTVNGAPAAFTRSGQELLINPGEELTKGERFTVAVTYAGSPKTIVGSPVVFGAPYGWIYTKDGAFVGDEPAGASTWFPSNDHPYDKATFTFRIAVPTGLKVIANGEHAPFPTTAGARNTFVWNESAPMATYLATIAIGRWDLREGRTPGGIPELMAYDPSLTRQVAARQEYALTGQVTDFWVKEFGPYPFTSTGAIIDHVPGVGFSLETQTRPLYGFAPDPSTVAHELAHQWFGDDVSVASWRDIWLNEGFASFAEFLWTEHIGGASTWVEAQGAFDNLSKSTKFWDQAIADPQRNTMFSKAVYQRGALTLAALRHRIGNTRFFALLRTWTRTHRYGNASTAQFIALADQISGQHLDHFFQIWLYTKSRPASLTAG